MKFIKIIVLKVTILSASIAASTESTDDNLMIHDKCVHLLTSPAYVALAALSSLEQQRDKSFIEVDSLYLERFTRQISVLLIKEYNILQTELSSVINSIIKTRHLFPGKIDILRDFYMIETLISFVSPQSIALIMIVDAIADISINDLCFYEMFNDIKMGKDNIFIKNKILGQLENSVLNKLILKNARIEIEKHLSDISLMLTIYEMEQSFSPIILFRDLYYRLMVHPSYNGFEVIGIDKYIYWPATLKQNERENFQNLLSKNDFCGRFKPLSLVTMQIDLEATKHFKALRGHVGSFIPYVTNHFNGINPEILLLITKNQSKVKYNSEAVAKLKQNYANKPTPTRVTLKEDLRYYAEQGIAVAAYEYALMLHTDKEYDHSLSFNYLKRAALQEYVNAQYTFGLVHFKGMGVVKDEGKAVQWYSLSANQGHVKAQYALGNAYLNGIGVVKDEGKAAQWYNLSANQGNAKAQYALGNAYLNGIGVVKDEEKAVQWYRLSADQGHAKAQYALGNAYLNGIGVAKDDGKSEYWRVLAISRGHVDIPYVFNFAQVNDEGCKNIKQYNNKRKHGF
jgi:TPR repeat protein